MAAVPGPPISAQFVTDVAAALQQGTVTGKDALHRLKQRLAREHGARLPRDGDLLEALQRVHPELAERYAPVLRQKPMRTQSGVAVVAVMSSPAHCPHGKCIYCPGGPEVDAPQSYTGFEPSTMRAKRFDYQAYRIVRHRLGQLARNGHATDKVDIVIQGGTFPARDAAYRDWFVASIYAGLNAGPCTGTADADCCQFDDEASWAQQAADDRQQALSTLQEANESAACRCIGLTIETKPDWCLESHIDEMLRYGATRVELGIQTLDDATLALTNRGHDLQATRDSLRVAKDAGLKICAHMMPGQPRPPHLRTDAQADLDDLRRLFEEPDWRPDMLKIYPTLVVMEGETTLKKWWKEGRFEALDTEHATALVGEAKGAVPSWCRIQRIDRDIPTTHLEAGVDKSNLRQLAQQWRRQQGLPDCVCLRCREVGTRLRAGHSIDPTRVRLVRQDYEASGGTEVFLSLEDPAADAVVAYLRLRRVAPKQAAHRPEFNHPAGAAVVREVKVPGVAVPVGTHGSDTDLGEWQHQGHGSRLLAEAERIAAEEWQAGRVLVIAGVGVKAYYRMRGYEDLGAYVAKSLPAGTK